MPTDREYIRRALKGDVGSMGLSDAEDAANKAQQRHVTVFRPKSTSLLSLNIPLLYTSHAIKVISCSILPGTSVSTNTENFASLCLWYDDGAGGSDTALATTIRTNATAFTALTKTAFTITAANAEVAASKQVMLLITAAGASGSDWGLGDLTFDLVYQEV